MALVECVGGESPPVVPYFLEHFFVVTVFLPSGNKLGVQMVQLFYLFFTHGFAQRVALAARESCKLAREEHDLLLVYGNAVSVFQVFFHARYVVLDRLYAVLARYELRNVAHRPGTVEGVHGY